MFKKSYFVSIVVLLIIGIVSCFIGFSSVTKGFRDRMTAVFKPEHSETLYIDIGSDYSDNADGDIQYHGTSSFKVKRLIDKTSIDGPVICDDYKKFDEYREMFENEADFASMTVAAIFKSSNITSRGSYISNIARYNTDTDSSYSECDLKPILMAAATNQTWQDIGYLSEGKVVVVLPAKDTAYYDYVIGQLYAALDDDNQLTESDIDKYCSIVDKVVENSLVYSDGMAFESNYIFIGCEQGSIFKYLHSKNRIESVYFTKAVYPSVKIFYTDKAIEILIEDQAEKCKSNFLVSKCGYRFLNNDNYSSKAMDGRNHWNIHSPNTINRCVIGDWEWEYLSKNH